MMHSGRKKKVMPGICPRKKKVIHELSFFVEEERLAVAVKKEIRKDLEQKGKKLEHILITKKKTT
jgi:hypothetical protein